MQRKTVLLLTTCSKFVDMNVCSTAKCVPLLIQQNVDGSDFFNRSWAEFKVGFSDTSGNYWLGNDLLSQLTQDDSYKLRFDLQQRNSGDWYWAEYSRFRVKNETYNYQLQVSGFLGNTNSNAFTYQDGAMFTTYDRDNDLNPNVNNAVLHGGGFWYTWGARSCVNTVRGGSIDFKWYEPSTTSILLETSRMWLTCQ